MSTRPFFRQIPVGTMKNLVYLVGCPKSKECAVIDCGFEPEKIYQEAKTHGYRITKILLTHVHYDHSGRADALSRKTGAPIYMNPKSEKKRGKNPEKGMWIIPKKTTPLLPHDTITIGEISGKVIDAPGHQSDHYLFQIHPFLFTGDTLFIGSIGRTDLPDSNPESIKSTLNTICTLDDNLFVCPGHDYGSTTMKTLRKEKENNPFLD